MADFTQQLCKDRILEENETWKDEKKCRAIRYVLEHIGWIECLDANWEKNVSKRWAIGKDYPRYNEFVEYVGQFTLDRIRNMGMASLQDWESMGNIA